MSVVPHCADLWVVFWTTLSALQAESDQTFITLFGTPCTVAIAQLSCASWGSYTADKACGYFTHFTTNCTTYTVGPKFRVQRAQTL